jgi:N-acetyl-alpha-D-muramate 1-phosphate uridylyltransferase
MRAMILAAGLGTRLRPVTEKIPKALVEVDGRTLLEHSIAHLRGAGIQDVIINVHHFAGQVMDFLEVHNFFGMNISISDETGGLLETGGGLKKAAWFFSGCESAVVRNVDIISDLDLEEMNRFHLQNRVVATLAIRKRATRRYFLFDDGDVLSGWENKTTCERVVTREAQSYTELAFSGIQIIDPAIFPLITEDGKFSLTEMYLRLSRSHVIMGYRDESSVWRDAGKQDK